MTSAAPPAAALRLHFSTVHFSGRDRLAAWREIFGRTVCNLDIEPIEPERFNSEATACRLPGLGVMFGTTAPIRLNHTSDLILDDDLSFMAAPAGRWTASQLGRNPLLHTGDGVLMSNADVGDMTLASNTRFTTFRVPRAAMAPLVPDIGSVIARRVPAASPPLQLLTRYLDIFREVEALASPQLQHLAVTHVYDLLALALGATRDAAAVAKERGLRAARLHAIKAYIVARAGDDLSIDAIAAAQGVTRRYVQMLFEEDGTTFTHFVLDQRLANARRMLLDRRLAHHTIAAIAFDAGFHDLSYFNRTFRRRFGCSPSELRAYGAEVEPGADARTAGCETAAAPRVS
jgi:AraC-like DNA-binding protein